MLRKRFTFQIAAIGVLVLAANNHVSAQKVDHAKNRLAKFEKSIAAGDHQLIERDLLDYAITNPRDAKVFELLGNVRFAQNRLTEAKSLYQKALSLDQHSAAIKISLAATDFQIGNREQAISGLNEIADQNVANQAQRLKLAEAFALVGDCPRSLNNIEKLDARIKSADALPVRARCYLQSNEKQKAVSLIVPAKTLF